ncbi:MAG TPA: D-cysteine desulfhydrase family protein [Lacipirellula sp.]
MNAIHDQLNQIGRMRLAHLPTPLDDMLHLRLELDGPWLMIKRDDLTGLAGGGNKARKLEFLMADVLRTESDCVITAGGPQSNHCRQTAAAANQLGVECHLVIGGDPRPPVGNLLLDHVLGANIHWVPRANRNARMAELAQQLEAAGRRPYVIPVGGSNALGALGYVAAMFELVEQMAEEHIDIDHIIFATSSGGTQAGLVLGAKLAGYTGRLTAISIDQTPDDKTEEKFIADVCRVANLAAVLLKSDVRLSVEDFVTNYDYLGGYGVLGDLERNAIRLLAQTEGVLVGPVYTGRAAGAMIDLIQRGTFSRDETVLFWHTGDDAALHAYAEELL